MKGANVAEIAERVYGDLSWFLVGNLRIRPLVLDDCLQHLVCVRDDFWGTTRRSRGVEEYSEVVDADRLRWSEDELFQFPSRSRIGDELRELIVLQWCEVRHLHPSGEDLLGVGAVRDYRLTAALREQLEDYIDIAEVSSKELRRVSQRGDGDRVDQVGELPTSEPTGMMVVSNCLEKFEDSARTRNQ